MAVDERRRRELFTRIAAAIGEEAATTMFELLPPETEIATRTDVGRAESRSDRRFDQIDSRLHQIDSRLDQIDSRLDQIDSRLDRLEQRVDERAEALRNELVAIFRGELVTAVAGQTRALIVATATAVVGIGGLAVTLAQVL